MYKVYPGCYTVGCTKNTLAVTQVYVQSIPWLLHRCNVYVQSIPQLLHSWMYKVYPSCYTVGATILYGIISVKLMSINLYTVVFVLKPALECQESRMSYHIAFWVRNSHQFQGTQRRTGHPPQPPWWLCGCSFCKQNRHSQMHIEHHLRETSSPLVVLKQTAGPN